MPKISVIIPVYNVEKYLRECLESVIKQTLTDIEIICINDGSTDTSGEILEEYAQKDSRIKVFSRKNKGVSAARNIGIKEAQGDYICFIDSDDWIEKTCLEASYNKITQENADIVVFNNNNVCNKQLSQEEYKSDILIHYENKQIILEDLQYLNNYIWDKLFKRDFILNNNILFPENIKNNEDGIFCFECLFSNAKYCCLPKVLYNYRKIQKNSAMCKAKDLIMNDAEAMKFFIKSNLFKSAPKNLQIIALNKFLSGFLYHYNNERNKYCRFIYNYQIAKIIKELPLYADEELLKATNIYDSMQHTFSVKHWLIQHIFSITNNYDGIKKRKKIILGGIKLNFKINVDKKMYKKFIKNKLSKNSILIVEGNTCHAETILGFAKYFSELGYNVDIICTKFAYAEKSFEKINNIVSNVYPFLLETIQKALSSDKIKEYEYVFFNSYQLYYDTSSRFGTNSVFDYFKNIVSSKNGFIALEHHLDKIDENLCNDKRILQLNKFKKDAVFCNSHYYGEIAKHTKNKITEFVLVGAIQSYRKDFDLLIDTITELRNAKIDNFHVTVIGDGNLYVPPYIKDKITLTGRLSYDLMFKYIEKSDFILSLFNPCNEEHNRYRECGSSGSFQLSYGFKKPIVIHSLFAEIPMFNNSNAVIYTDDFVEKIKECINMSDVEYQEKVYYLSDTVEKIEKESLRNLKMVLNKQ